MLKATSVLQLPFSAGACLFTAVIHCVPMTAYHTGSPEEEVSLIGHVLGLAPLESVLSGIGAWCSFV